MSHDFMLGALVMALIWSLAELVQLLVRKENWIG